MGASSSVQQPLGFPQEPHYAQWTVAQVREAVGRLVATNRQAFRGKQAQLRRGERAQFVVNKRTYWEVFTDFLNVGQDGGFLCLPIEHFDEIFDKGHRSFIDILQVFAVLAIWCQGELEERMGLLYDIVVSTPPPAGADPESATQAPSESTSGSAQMSRTQLVEVFRAALMACFNLDIIYTTPSTTELNELVDEMFTSFGLTGARDTLAKHAFVDVCKAHYVSRELLKRYHLRPDVDTPTDDARATATRSPFQALHGLEPTKSMLDMRMQQSKMNRLKRRSGASDRADGDSSSKEQAAAKSPSTFFPEDITRAALAGSTQHAGQAGGAEASSAGAGAGAGAGAVDDTEAGVFMDALKSPPSALHATSSLLGAYSAAAGTKKTVRAMDKEGGVDFSSLSALHNRTRAHKLKLVAGRRVMQELVSKVHFSMHELQQLARTFSDTSDVTGYLSKAMFREVLQKQMPALRKDPVLLERIYAVSDLDGDGRVNFKEFTLGISRLLRGDTSEKLTVLFSLYDVNKDGSIELGELIHLVKQKHDDLQSLIDFAGELVESLDADGDNEVSRDEFAEALRKDKVVRDTFLHLIMVQFGMRTALRRLQLAVPEFDWARFRLVVNQLRKEPKVMIKLASITDFTDIMTNRFGVPEKHQDLVATIFEQFDLKQHGGHVPVRDALNGMGQVMAPTENDFENLVFDLYDLDGDGTLTKNEILHMLLSATQTTHESARRVIEALAHLDTDGDGQISLREFKARASSMPALMEALRVVLGVMAPRDLPTVHGAGGGDGTSPRRTSSLTSVKSAGRSSQASSAASSPRLGGSRRHTVTIADRHHMDDKGNLASAVRRPHAPRPEPTRSFRRDTSHTTPRRPSGRPAAGPPVVASIRHTKKGGGHQHRKRHKGAEGSRASPRALAALPEVSPVTSPRATSPIAGDLTRSGGGRHRRAPAPMLGSLANQDSFVLRSRRFRAGAPSLPGPARVPGRGQAAPAHALGGTPAGRGRGQQHRGWRSAPASSITEYLDMEQRAAGHEDASMSSRSSPRSGGLPSIHSPRTGTGSKASAARPAESTASHARRQQDTASLLQRSSTLLLQSAYGRPVRHSGAKLRRTASKRRAALGLGGAGHGRQRSFRRGKSGRRLTHRTSSHQHADHEHKRPRRPSKDHHSGSRAKQGRRPMHHKASRKHHKRGMSPISGSLPDIHKGSQKK